MRAHRATWWMATAAVVGSASAQQTSVVSSPHNLSASGPGSTRATVEDQVCIFCHAPHNSTPVRPLWNRSMPIDSYLIYSSRALDAAPGQPTGTSKMCLSCHDGTIALGAVVSRDTPIVMSGGVQTLSTGSGHIGTDLTDDHPISFRFDSTLAARDPRLRSPSSLPDAVRLDPGGELQCSSCHDAHNNFFGDFLVMQNSNSELCTACHSVGTTTVSGHRQCASCHQSHTAPSGPYLLRGRNITETCTRCHDGTVPLAANIAADLRKVSVHDTDSPVDPPDPPEGHTTCTSCHDPHTMGAGASRAPLVHGNFGRINGTNSSGAEVATATFEYEVCFNCHADGDRTRPLINRVIAQTNTRLEFAPNAVSFHPVETNGRNSEMPSLLPPWTVTSIMSCSECHSSEASVVAGGPGPSGTHGSNNIGLLSDRYVMEDYTSESASNYALCYRCHDRDNILSEDSSSFPGHRPHIVGERTPCSACHDAHGIPSTQGNAQNNANLINFDTRIVQPNSRGLLKFQDLGRYRGECFLRCHGVDHDGRSYESNR